MTAQQGQKKSRIFYRAKGQTDWQRGPLVFGESDVADLEGFIKALDDPYTEYGIGLADSEGPTDLKSGVDHPVDNDSSELLK
jgi:hypothetical protein